MYKYQITVFEYQLIMCHFTQTLHQSLFHAEYMRGWFKNSWISQKTVHHTIDGILLKGPYPPCLRMADRALLAGYPHNVAQLAYACLLPWRCVRPVCRVYPGWWQAAVGWAAGPWTTVGWCVGLQTWWEGTPWGTTWPSGCAPARSSDQSYPGATAESNRLDY